MRERMKGLLLTGLGLPVLLLSSCNDERESYTVEKQGIVESVYSSVVIEPEGMYNVNATVAGILDALLVEPGDSVEQGDILFTIRDIQSESQAENAKLAYELAKQNYSGDLNVLNELQLELNNARLKRKNDSVNYERNKTLYSSGALTKVELEGSELAFEASVNNHELLKNKISRLKRELKISMNQAKNTYESSLSRSKDAIVKNMVNGIVYDIYKEPGELVMTQEPIAVIGSANKFVINMMIDEVDITRVRVGQDIFIRLEAYGEKVFKAKVRHIIPKMDQRTQTFRVEGEFVEKPEKLYLGLTGEGNIVVNEIGNSVVIPREYVYSDSLVDTPEGSKVIKTGAKSLSHIQILSGLKEGDIIYKPE